MKTETKTLSQAMRILASSIESDDGVANAAIFEAAERLDELQQERDALRSQVDSLQQQKQQLLLGFDDYKKMQNIADAEIKAQAIKSILDNCHAYSIMNTYGICVEDIVEYANKIRSEAKK